MTTNNRINECEKIKRLQAFNELCVINILQSNE